MMLWLHFDTLRVGYPEPPENWLDFVKTFEAKSIKAEVTDSSQLSQLDKFGLTTEHVEVAEEETDVKDVKPEPGKVFCNLKAKNSKEEEEGGNDDSTPVYK